MWEKTKSSDKQGLYSFDTNTLTIAAKNGTDLASESIEITLINEKKAYSTTTLQIDYEQPAVWISQPE